MTVIAGFSINAVASAYARPLQAAQRKVLDVINSVGLSDSLLCVIDRRQRMDRWITYGGMVRCCIMSKKCRIR